MEGRAIDKGARNSHQSAMRLMIALLSVAWTLGLVAPAAADPRALKCSTGKWGHVHCIRAEHFVYDTCNAIETFSTRHGLNMGFFARLIWQESRCDPNALSPANARGIAQFIPSTARLRGLKDPYNPADALEHSAQYLAEMVKKYGNGGERRAEGFLEGKGLAQETVNYVPIITGLTAEQWRDTPPKDHDSSLAPEKSFFDACSEMATNRRLTPIKRVAPPPRRSSHGACSLALAHPRNPRRKKCAAAQQAAAARLHAKSWTLSTSRTAYRGRKAISSPVSVATALRTQPSSATASSASAVPALWCRINRRQISSGKCFIVRRIGFGAACPRPQIEASTIAADSSSSNP